MSNLCKKEKKSKVGVVLAVIGGIVLIAAAAYAVYRWVMPMFLDNLDDDFDDEFDEDFFEDDDYIVDIFEETEEVVVPETEEATVTEEM